MTSRDRAIAYLDGELFGTREEEIAQLERTLHDHAVAAVGDFCLVLSVFLLVASIATAITP